MPKRKIESKVELSESELSSPPEDLSLEEIEKSSPKRRRTTNTTSEYKTISEKRTTSRQKATVGVKEASVKIEKENDTPNATPKSKTGKTTKEVKEEAELRVQEDGNTKVTRKRKTKEEKREAAMPLSARTSGHKLFIGAHVSSAGGVQNTIANSVHIGANAFALFLKSQRKWANPPLAEDQCSSFHSNCQDHAYNQGRHVVPHGSYLVNLAHTDHTRTEQAYESYLDDLKRCDRLGIKLYNIHPGNTVSNDRQKAIAHLASNINRGHKETKSVITLLENMAAGGNVLGSTFEDLRDTIALVDQKERIGVCIDTCHAFAAGYDLRTPTAFRATMDHFEDVVGFKYLRAMHINDSKAPFASHRDLHANIGTGFLGLRAFHNVVNETRFEGIPLVLETPIDATDADGTPLKDDKGKEKEDKAIWAREIKLLESLVGMDVESDEFLTLEKDLARKGEPERKRLAEQQERKKEKEAKKAKGSRKRGKKDETDDEESNASD